MADREREIVRRFVEEFQGQGRTEVGEELLAADFRNHTPGPGESADRDGVLRQFAMLRAGLPDLRVTVHSMLAGSADGADSADGGRVATHKTFHGTHRGT